MNYRYLDAELAARLEEIGQAYDAALARREEAADVFSVVIIGQQNNGKSTLCNALCRDWDNRKFPVADRRLTSSVQEELDEDSGILYVDTPGFSSATTSDDERARAEWIRANLLIFVHSIRSGELDADEVRILQSLESAVSDLDRRLFVACSKAGGENPDNQRLKMESVRTQIRELVGIDPAIEAVDSVFYQKGMEKGNEQLVASTNIPRLLDWIAAGRNMSSSLETFLRKTGDEYARLLEQARDRQRADMDGMNSRRQSDKNRMLSCWTSHESSVRDAWNRCARYK